MVKELVNKIKEYNTIIIHRHNRPDLDALGSQKGLALSIKATYPNKEVYVVGDMLDRYNFLGNMDIIEDNKYSNALVIICDVAVSALISDDRYKLAQEVYIIDHHTNTSDISNAKTIIDSSYIAAAERVTEILYDNGFVVTKDAATALYGGIVSDSGRFQYNNTSPRTFLMASKLVASGADMQFIYNNLYVETLESKKLKNYFSSKFEVTEDGVGYMFNKEDVFEKFKVDFFTVSRGMIGVMAGIEEIKIWCNFTVDIAKNVIACEFRSREIPIVDIAKNYGGGGHDLACGASVESWDVVDKIIEEMNLRAKGE